MDPTKDIELYVGETTHGRTQGRLNLHSQGTCIIIAECHHKAMNQLNSEKLYNSDVSFYFLENDHLKNA